MFEITKDQLRQFGDVDLRELVARLCEAELLRAGAPASAIRWGGAHTARDGGLDVDCHIEEDGFSGDFVPRPRTGFQVKKPKMPPAEIAKEMSPKGQIRPALQELAASNGCYIIVSLDDDPSVQAAARRKKAMRLQIKDLSESGDLRTDFYGRAELANWLRQHLGVQLWARGVLGMPLDGWKSLDRWTSTPPGDADELICRPGVSIALPGRDADKLDIEHGIGEIRNLIRNSDKALRIVGLSGVGKTRIVQALFEGSVGDDPLDLSLAVYTDLGTDPNPTPSQMLARLGAEGHPAILVLDNCPADTHSLLAGGARATPNLRLITIEYDIREDRPEDTAVIRIEADRDEIVETLVLRRFPDLGHVNARKIAEFSGGNARLGLALADAVGEAGNLSGFSNAQLFDRLFYQRGVRDADLLTAARALALVYSFSVEVDEGGVDELATLAELVGLARLALYGAAQSLLERQLAQKRGRWRAVLPPAVSNRLAAQAIDYIPIGSLRDTFEQLHSGRLLNSFGKRLGYLHDHDGAKQIVRSWLSPGGLLHEVESLDDDRVQLLANVAPVDPQATLDTIERRATRRGARAFFAASSPRTHQIAHLLFKVAYDSELFERCVALLAQCVIAGDADERRSEYFRGRLCGLFALYLSGTEAGPDTRERVIRRFLRSEDRDERILGLEMLGSALRSQRWSSSANLEFGARPRSFGHRPTIVSRRVV